MKFLCEGVQKLKPEQRYTQTDRHTDIQTHTHRQTETTENITYPHIRVVTNVCSIDSMFKLHSMNPGTVYPKNMDYSNIPIWNETFPINPMLKFNVESKNSQSKETVKTK